MKLFRLPFSDGVLELKKSGEVVAATYTPLKELPVFSLAEGKVVKRDPFLDGFFVQIPNFGEFFIPQSHAFNVNVGSKVLVQVVRERLEDKPPLVSTKIFLPFCGCYAVLNNKSWVKLLDNRKPLEVFKEFTERWNVSLTVYNGERCLNNLPKLEGIVKKIHEKALSLPFLWKGFYTFLLEDCGGEVRVPDRELCKDLKPFEELVGFNVPCGEVTLEKFLKEANFSKFSNYLFSQRKNFDGGYLLTGEVGGITVIDVNGYGSKSDINQNALKEIVRFVKTNRVGGVIVIDFAGLKMDPNLKGELKRLLAPLRCSVRGFTNSGLFEIVCPKLGPTVKERMGEYSPVCDNLVKSDEVLLYEILEQIPQVYTEKVLIKLNPLRKGLEEKLSQLLRKKFEIFLNWEIPINKFLVEF